MVTPSKPPPPTNNFCLYPPPVLRCFWKDPLMTPTTPLQASFTATPHPLPKNFDHTLKCKATHENTAIFIMVVSLACLSMTCRHVPVTYRWGSPSFLLAGFTGGHSKNWGTVKLRQRSISVQPIGEKLKPSST